MYPGIMGFSWPYISTIPFLVYSRQTGGGSVGKRGIQRGRECVRIKEITDGHLTGEFSQEIDDSGC
jgi:hypothetical protein